MKFYPINLWNFPLQQRDIMQKRDEFTNHGESGYLNLLERIIETGNYRKPEGEEGRFELFAEPLRFDLTDNKLPLMTTKKVFFKSLAVEMLWFLSGQQDTALLRDYGVNIWKTWEKENMDFPSEKRLIGWVKKAENHEYVAYSGNFLTDGINVSANSDDNKLRNTWLSMMSRCYKSDSHNYEYYGAKGVSVCKEWHNPEKFISDVKKLPNWDKKLRDWNIYQLDKDYYGANIYSPQTCAWLHQGENKSYSGIPVRIVDNKGIVSLYTGTHAAADAIGMSYSSMHRIVTEGMPSTFKRDNKKFSGWIIEEAKKEGYVLRRLFTDGVVGPLYGFQWRHWQIDPNAQQYYGGATEIDQIAEVVATLRDRPEARSHMVTAWRPDHLNMMSIKPCHILLQFYRYGDEISLVMFQRSCDTYLGVAFNVAQYSLLVHMIAHQLGCTAKEFIWIGGDVHVYENHVDQVREQLTKPILDVPTIEFLRKPDDLFSYRFEDFKVNGYAHAGYVPAEVSAQGKPGCGKRYPV